MKKLKRRVKTLAALLLAVGVAAAFVLWRIGGERGSIQQLCAAAPGMTLAQLNTEIEKRALRAIFDKGSAIVHGKKTFGRVVCLIDYEGDAVKKAVFNVAD